MDRYTHTQSPSDKLNKKSTTEKHKKIKTT